MRACVPQRRHAVHPGPSTVVCSSAATRTVSVGLVGRGKSASGRSGGSGGKQERKKQSSGSRTNHYRSFQIYWGPAVYGVTVLSAPAKNATTHLTPPYVAIARATRHNVHDDAHNWSHKVEVGRHETVMSRRWNGHLAVAE
jgi:hypothetical protein